MLFQHSATRVLNLMGQNPRSVALGEPDSKGRPTRLLGPSDQIGYFGTQNALTNLQKIFKVGSNFGTFLDGLRKALWEGLEKLLGCLEGMLG